MNIAGSRVLVTGASGFIGAHLVSRLLKSEAEVIAVQRSPEPRPRLLPLADHVRIVSCDLSDASAVHALISETAPRFVFHLAAAGIGAATTAPEVLSINVGGTANLLNALCEVQPEKVIYAGSCFEYGEGTGMDEGTALRPTAVYGASKAAGHLLAHSLRRSVGLPVVTVRPFTCFGPMEAARRLVPHVILSALDGRDIPLTPGEQERDFVYVEDVADGFLAALKAEPGHAAEAFNLCRGESVTVRAMVEMILDVMGNPVKAHFGALPYRTGEMWVQSGDPRLTARVLGWSAATPLREGIAGTVEWIRRNRGLAERLTAS